HEVHHATCTLGSIMQPPKETERSLSNAVLAASEGVPKPEMPAATLSDHLTLEYREVELPLHIAGDIPHQRNVLIADQLPPLRPQTVQAITERLQRLGLPLWVPAFGDADRLSK